MKSNYTPYCDKSIGKATFVSINNITRNTLHWIGNSSLGSKQYEANTIGITDILKSFLDMPYLNYQIPYLEYLYVYLEATNQVLFQPLFPSKLRSR